MFFLRICQNAVNICAAIIECREQKSGVWITYHPVTLTCFKHSALIIVGNPRLREIYWADAALNISVNLVGSIVQCGIIRSLARNVISAIHEQNHVVTWMIIICDHIFIEFIERFIIFQRRISKLHQQFLWSTRFFSLSLDLSWK